MTKSETRKYDMLTRVGGFAATYGQLFSETSAAHEAFASLAAELDHLERLEVAERSAFDGSRAGRRDAARGVFETLLKRAGATARVLGNTIPQLQARIRLPLPKDNLQLLALARQFAGGVASYGIEFAARGIPLATFEAGIAAFEEALAHHGNSREQRVTVRAEREGAFARARQAVATLDVTIANCITDPIALALWEHDRRVTPPRRRSAEATEPATEAASSQPPMSPGWPPPTEPSVSHGTGATM